jgi:hypothetical protein
MYKIIDKVFIFSSAISKSCFVNHFLLNIQNVSVTESLHAVEFTGIKKIFGKETERAVESTFCRI